MTSNSEDEMYMLEALQEASKAGEIGEVPIGAVIVTARGNIIARAHNLTQTLRDVTAHAEIQAITAAEMHLGSKYLKGCTLYVTVEPCAMCAGALAWSQIERIVYGIEEPKRGYSRYSDKILHPKTSVTSGVLADDALSLMQHFFKKLR